MTIVERSAAFESHHGACLRCKYGTRNSTKNGVYKFDGCPRGKQLRRSYSRAKWGISTRTPTEPEPRRG